jgi:hypothetical protein
MRSPEETIEEISKKFLPETNPLSKAKIIYDWMTKNIEYDHERRKNVESGIEDCFPRTAEETLKKGKGICTDLTELYCTIAYYFGIPVRIAEIDTGNPLIGHVCAAIPWKDGYVFVDPAKKGFDVKYEKYRIVEEDQEVKQVEEPLSESEKKSCIAIVLAAGIGALCMLGYCAMYQIDAQRKRVIEAQQTAGGISFRSPSGAIDYYIPPDAREPWKTLLFYEEAKKGTALQDAELFDLCQRIDKINDDATPRLRTLSLEEITDACRRAEREYKN